MSGAELLQAGDIVELDLDPVRGTEQSGFRPALVISEAAFHDLSRRALVCPITRNVSPYPTKVVLPEGLTVRGAVLVDQARSIDRFVRGVRVIGLAPSSLLLEVRARLASLIGLPPPA